MNLVLDEAEEVSIKKNTRKPLGEFILDSLFDNMLHLAYGSITRVYTYFQEGFYSKETT